MTESGVAVESDRSPKAATHMPKPASSNQNAVPSFQPPRPRPRWIAASACFLTGLLVTVAFLDFAPEQSRQTGTNFRQVAPNLVGSVGAEFTWWALHVIGVSIWLIPPFLFWMTYLALRSAKQLASTRVIAMTICVISAACLTSMIESFGKTQYFTEGLGGLLGNLVYQGAFKDTLGVFGTVLLLGTTYAICFVFIIVHDIGAEFDKLVHWLHTWRERRAAAKAEAAELLAQVTADEAKRAAAAKSATTPPMAVSAPPPGKKLTLPRTGNTGTPGI